MPTPTRLSRRSLIAGSAAAGLVGSLPRPSYAASPAIRKPTPARWFVDYGTNAEMRWDSVDPDRFLTAQRRLFVRNHTATPAVDAATYRLRVFGDGLTRARSEGDALEVGLDDLKAVPVTRLTSVHECTGNGRSFFGTQQGTPAAGTQWKLGAVGAVHWEGVRLIDLLERIGLRPDAVDAMPVGLDATYVVNGTDYGHIRRPVPLSKVRQDVLLAWGANGADLLPDHGYPLRLVVPGWVGIASIKWLGSLEISSTRLSSPWNTMWYRMSGGDWPADSPPLSVNPVRSAWELAEGAELPRRGRTVLTGRSWSGAAPIRQVEVSLDGGEHWRAARLADRGGPWRRWAVTWHGGRPGETQLLARATDAAGRTQPDVARYNDGGYFFDAVVRHPVVVG